MSQTALNPPPPPPPQVEAVREFAAELQGVYKSFDDVQALRGLDLQIPHGLVGVLGPNGAGKSTLFRLLLGLDNASQGAVTVLGERMPEGAMQVRASTGYMPEDDSLFPDMTALEQVVHAAQLCGLPRVDAIARAHGCLDLVGLPDARYRQAAQFSLGMRQRLRLAMAVVHGPKLLIVDEPTAGLDPDGRLQMLNLLAEIAAQGTSVLLSTHVLTDVEMICQHVVLMSRGQLGFNGPIGRFRAGGGQPLVRARVVGEPALLQAALQKHGLGSTIDQGAVVVTMRAEDAATFWQAAAESGVGISGYAPEEEDMAHAFVRHLRIDDPQRPKLSQKD